MFAMSPAHVLAIIVLCFPRTTIAHTQSVLKDFQQPVVDYDEHAHWMRKAIGALFDVSPCPFQAYGTAIVNHTAERRGQLICTGANEVIRSGNPSLHGEIAAIKNCTEMLRDPNGAFKLTAAEIGEAWHDFTLYTTGEACSMCATAIRFAGFKGYVYATNLDKLVEFGWAQLSIPSKEVFDRSVAMGPPTNLTADILSNETDPLLAWQYDSDYPCPSGCSRSRSSHLCEADSLDIGHSGRTRQL